MEEVASSSRNTGAYEKLLGYLGDTKKAEVALVRYAKQIIFSLERILQNMSFCLLLTIQPKPLPS